MKLWHKDLISLLSKQRLLEQWRDCCAIANNIKELGNPNDVSVNKIMDYKLSHFYKYCQLIANEMYKRNYDVSNESIEQIISITDGDIRMQADCFLTYDELFAGWHNDEYLRQCIKNGGQDERNCV